MPADNDHNPLFVSADSMEWGEQYATAQELANAFGAPVYEPWWPAGAGPRRYRRRRPGTRRPFDTYAMLASVPAQEEPLIVRGIMGPPDEVAGDHEWQPVPELATHGGIALTDPNGILHVLVERPGLVVHLAGFSTLVEAIEVARGLREREPLETPGLFVHVGSYDEGEHFGNAQELADALGRPVHEPTWPAGAGPRRFVLRRSDFYSPVDTYTILTDLPGQAIPALLRGSPGPTSHKDGQHGWWAEPELAHVNGLAAYEGPPAVAVEVSGMSVQLVHLRSIEEAIRVAKTLREYRPRRG